MTLRTLLQSDAENHFLLTDQFAETVQYYGEKGKADPVAVRGICDLEQGMPDELRGIVQHTILRFTCSRDDTNTVTGGISDPQIGDRLQLTQSGVTKEFSFSGEHPTGDEFVWTLIFNNFDLQRLGGNNVR